MQNLRFVFSAVLEILGGSQNLKVAYVTQETLPCDLILYFLLAPSGPRLSCKFQLDWTYCFRDIAIVRFWHFGWKMPIRAYF